MAVEWAICLLAPHITYKMAAQRFDRPPGECSWLARCKRRLLLLVADLSQPIANSKSQTVHVTIYSQNTALGTVAWAQRCMCFPKRPGVASQPAHLGVWGVTAAENGYSATGRSVKQTAVCTQNKAENTAWTWQLCGTRKAWEAMPSLGQRVW